MSNSVKLKGDNFLDSTSIVHNKETLDVILGRMAGIGGACKIISGDLNTACGNATGFYMGYDLTNCPTGVTQGNWWFVIHIVHDKNIAKQIGLSLAKRQLEHLYERKRPGHMGRMEKDGFILKRGELYG